MTASLVDDVIAIGARDRGSGAGKHRDDGAATAGSGSSRDGDLA